MKKQIAESLKALGLDGSDFSNFDQLDNEFKFLRRNYLKKCLATHPDKGGDANEFRNVNESFEFLKDLIGKKLITTLAGSPTSAAQEYEFTYSREERDMPSYEYYQEAAEHEMPAYRVEYAKSGRGKCYARKNSKMCGPFEEEVRIEKEQVRIGWLDAQSGSYGRWCHVHCWRVPSRIWLGLPDPDKESDPQVFIEALLKLDGVSLSGFADLKQQDQLELVKHVTDKTHWAARRTKAHKPTEIVPAATSSTESVAKPSPPQAVDLSASALIATGSQIVQKKKKFEIPVPGQGGALPNSLQGQTIVMTGIFPEVGGGAGLNLGKDKVKAMCQSFGARVTSAVSGKTTLLLVGKEPGMSKVQKAQQRKIPTTDIHNLCEVILGQVPSLEKAKPATITEFSSGYQRRYGHNGLALQYGKAYLEDLKRKSAAVSPKQHQQNNNNKRQVAAIEAGPLSARKSPAKKAKKKATPKKTVPCTAADKENTENPPPSTYGRTPSSNKKKKNPTVDGTNRAADATGCGNDYSQMTVVLLRFALKSRRLNQTGRKADLIARLEANDQQVMGQQKQQPQDYSTMNVNTLRSVLKERGLKKSGRKADLIGRLQENDQIMRQQETQSQEPPVVVVPRPPLQQKMQSQ